MKSFCRIALAALLLANNLIHAGFPAETLVKTPDGFRSIADLNKGDTVESLDSEKITSHTIITKKSTVEQGCIVIEVEHGIFVTSKQQLFYIPQERAWKEAQRLTQGDTLLQDNGEHTIVKNIISSDQPLELFDLSIKDSHNYFVSHASVLTHNFFPSITVGISLAFGGGGIKVASVTAGLAVLGGLIGLKVHKDKHRDRVEPTVIIESPYEQTCYRSPSPSPDPDDNKKRNNDSKKPKTIDDIINESSPGEKTKGKTKQFKKAGDYDKALKDFEEMQPRNVKDIKLGKVGTLNDGRTVNVRADSSNHKPTLEVYDGKRSIKIRYGN